MYSKPADYYLDCLQALAPGAESAWADIARAYSDRAYHNLAHLTEMLGWLVAFPTKLAPATAPVFGFALIYHDIVYKAGRGDNEAKSADMAEAALLKLGRSIADADYCRRLIMATKYHQPSELDAGTEGILIDLDLAVLGRDTAGYDDYAKAVRHEFRRYPGFLYRPGRKKALRHFLEQEHIYHTVFFRDKLEERARENLKRELLRL